MRGRSAAQLPAQCPRAPVIDLPIAVTRPLSSHSSTATGLVWPAPLEPSPPPARPPLTLSWVVAPWQSKQAIRRGVAAFQWRERELWQLWETVCFEFFHYASAGPEHLVICYLPRPCPGLKNSPYGAC